MGTRFCQQCRRILDGDADRCPADGAALRALADTLPAVGTLVDGRYRVRARIADGGIGVVFHAFDTRARRDVALKVLRPSLAGRAAAPVRFLADARAAAGLDDPRVIRVFEAGVSAEGHPFVAMELLAGGTLADALQRAGRLEVVRALSLAREVALALDHAHRRGVVHRDLKPENVFLADAGGPAPRVKLLDFGGAPAVDAGDTARGEVLGTPAYMSPEQVRGLPVDARGDLYALGVVLHEMLAGTPPYSGDGDAALMQEHLVGDLPDLPALPIPADAHRALRDLRDRLLARDPARRPAGAAEVVAALDALLARPELHAPVHVAATEAVASLAAMHSMDYERALRDARAAARDAAPEPEPVPFVPPDDGAPGDATDPVTVSVIHATLAPVGPEGGPLSARRLFGPERAAFVAAVEARGGLVVAPVADVVRIAFGVAVRDDEPWTPAVRAALELACRVARFARGTGMPVSVRIGVCTGYVLVPPGALPTPASALRGPLADLAAQLASEAAPGRVVLDDRTRRRLGDAFAFEHAGTLRVHGTDDMAPFFGFVAQECAG